MTIDVSAPEDDNKGDHSCAESRFLLKLVPPSTPEGKL